MRATILKFSMLFSHSIVFYTIFSHSPKQLLFRLRSLSRRGKNVGSWVWSNALSEREGQHGSIGSTRMMKAVICMRAVAQQWKGGLVGVLLGICITSLLQAPSLFTPFYQIWNGASRCYPVQLQQPTIGKRLPCFSLHPFSRNSTFSKKLLVCSHPSIICV